MPDKFVLVFPPQAIVALRMAQAWAARSPAAAGILCRADRVLGASLPGGMAPSALLRRSFGDAAACARSMVRSDVQQVAIFLASLACWAGLCDTDPRLRHGAGSRVVAALGLSLGEVAALVAAGVFPFDGALRFVVRRGQALQRLVDAGEAAAGLGCLLRSADEQVLRQIIETAKREEEEDDDETEQGRERDDVGKSEKKVGKIVLDVTRMKNSSAMVCGTARAVRRAVLVAQRDFGVQSSVVTDCAAFHTELMRPAVPEITAAFDEELLPHINARFEFPVVSNATARPFCAGDVRALLLQNITGRLRWKESVQFICNELHGADTEWLCLEPGAFLAGDLGRMKLEHQLNIRKCDLAPEKDDIERVQSKP